MKMITQFDYDRNANSISASYFPEGENEASGYIKLSREGSVIEERKSKFDKGEEYHKMAKSHLMCMWGIDPLPNKSIIHFS